MAGQGFAPKAPEERRNKTAPARGEWVDLQPLEKPILPELPAGEWSERTRDAWADWRLDPVTSQYGRADIRAAIDLAYVYEAWVNGKDHLAGEIRQRQDRLGLNPKGKRDLRWRIIEKPEERKRQPRRAPRQRAHLTAV